MYVTDFLQAGPASYQVFFDADVVVVAGADLGIELRAGAGPWVSFVVTGQQGSNGAAGSSVGSASEWRITATPTRITPVVGYIVVPQTGSIS